MKILALSDIHGSYDLAQRILRREANVDLVVIAGDITTHGSRTEALEAVAVLRAMAPRVLAIAGNMDSENIDAGLAEEGIGIDGSGVIVGEAGFFGVSGGPRSILRTPYERTEEELFRRAEQGWEGVAASRWKIFVPHAPPHGTRLDTIRMGLHVGSTGVRKFVDAHQPDLVVCGHIHESAGKDALGKTQMVNCGAVRDGHYALVEIEGDIRISCKELFPS
jgi:uncharacterized protein